MEDTFHFNLLRISIAQILKANGFDKCKPSTLNILTDIYIRYLTKLIQSSIKLSQQRTRSNTPELQDITQALILTGTIKSNNVLKIHDDKFEESPYNTLSIDSFKNWTLYSDRGLTMRKLNELPTNLIKNLIEKRKLDIENDGETDQQRKKRKYKQRQDYYNQLKLDHPDEEEDDEDLITSKDQLKWINYLIEKDLKLGHDLKFLNTTSNITNEFMKFQANLKFHPQRNNIQRINQYLANLNKHDYLVSEIDKVEEEEEEQVIPSQELINLLPYNLKYDENLLQDLTEELEEEELEEVADQQEELQQDEDNLIHEDNEFVQDMVINEEGIGGDNNLMFM
ncbi:Transcription initiation factor TFIID subunit 3 [Spathaspora sp. JA1]|nr:Transcription initiation factor TFIID subunit 3 [Spathaspora sp. JA1]